MKQIAGWFFALFIVFSSQPFSQEAIPPKDPREAVKQKGSPEWLLNQGREQLNSALLLGAVIDICAVN